MRMFRSFIMVLVTLILLTFYSGCKTNKNDVPLVHQEDIVETERPIRQELKDKIEQFRTESQREGTIAILCIPRDKYIELLDAPKLEKLYLNAYNVYYAKGTKEKQIIEFREEGDASFEVTTDGTFLIDDYPQPLEVLMSLASDTGKLTDFVSSNEPKKEVSERAVVYCEGRPLVIWVKAGKSDYYITVNEEELSDYYFSSENAVFRLYSKEEFFHMNSSEKMDIFVNGKAISSSAYLYGTVAEVPLLAVLDALNIQYDWKSKNEILLIRYDKNIYTLDISECSVVKDDEDINIIMPPPGDSSFVFSRENEIIMDEYSFTELLSAFDLHVSFNYTKLTVVIK